MDELRWYYDAGRQLLEKPHSMTLARGDVRAACRARSPEQDLIDKLVERFGPG